MTQLTEAAQLLVSCWALATDQERIPTSHGLLDQALKVAFDSGAFPAWLRERLHFVDARMGLECVELPAILNRAQEALLTVNPNPSYQYTQVRIKKDLAKELLSELEVSEHDAAEWGKVLYETVKHAEQDARAIEVGAYS